MDARQPKSRMNWLLGIMLGLTFVALDGPNRVLSHMAYALETGRIRAGADQLATIDQNLASVGEVSQAFRLVAKIARPGVVHIRVNGSENALGRLHELERQRRDIIDKLHHKREDSDEQPAETVEELTGRLREIETELLRLSERASPGSGSGIVFDPAGYILTNNHVVESGGEIFVQLPDQRQFEATVTGTDPKTDLAVIRIDASDVHPLKFGDSDLVEVGDWVLAVGAPFELSQTVTHGIISAVGRNDVRTNRPIQYQNFLQTDAAINPGNSGGPLLNMRGEVIGVNTAIATNGEGYNAGVAFTIPSNTAVNVAQQLKESGAVARGWLGISLSELTEEDVDRFGLADPRGTLVNTLFADSPADRAGVLCEDIITHVNGARVEELRQLQGLIAAILPGQVANLSVLRDGREETVAVKLGRQPDDMGRAALTNEPIVGMPIDSLKLMVRTCRPGLAQSIYDGSDDIELATLARTQSELTGVFVFKYIGTSGDAPVDVTPGELITSCDGEPVASVKALRIALNRVTAGARVKLEIRNAEGETRTESFKKH